MSAQVPKELFLYAPAPKGMPVVEHAAWVRELCSSSKRLGEASEYVLLPEVSCANWQCGWLEGYVARGSVVGAFFSGGKHIAALLQADSPDVLAQPALVSRTCLGAYQIPMSNQPRNREELVDLFNWAYVHLRDRGLLGPHYDRGLSGSST